MTIQGEGPVIGVPTVFVRVGGCDYRCLAAGTLISRSDLTTTPIERLQPGDDVLGYARVSVVKSGPLRLVPTVIEAMRELAAQPTLILTLDDGTTLICSPDHRWWVEQRQRGWIWKSPRRPGLEGNYREARSIRPGDTIKGAGKGLISPSQTEAWAKGYLSGAMDGDGHVSRTWIAFRVTSRTFFDALVGASERIGAGLVEFASSATTHGTPLYRARLPEARRLAYEQAVRWSDEPDFLRGYLAGMFDAEGHLPAGKGYITQNRGPILDRAVAAAQALGLPIRVWHSSGRSSRLYFETRGEVLLPYLDVQCHHKRLAAASMSLRGLSRTIVSIEAGPTLPLFDIQTGTRNFIANGVVSHNCSWCDTGYAVDPVNKDRWLSMSPDQIVDTVEALARGPIMVALSGGNPALFDGLRLVAQALRAKGYRVMMETQGSVPKIWLGNLDLLVVSPKGPSSGQPWTPGVRQKLEQTIACAASGGATIALKFVVGDDDDYRFAKRVSGLFPERAVYLQPCDPAPPPPEPEQERDPIEAADIRAFAAHEAAELHVERYRRLVRRVLDDRWLRPVVLPRAHVLVWGTERGR